VCRAGAAVVAGDEVPALRTDDDGTHQGVRAARAVQGCLEGLFHGTGFIRSKGSDHPGSGLQFHGARHAVADAERIAALEGAGVSASKSHRWGFIRVSFLPC